MSTAQPKHSGTHQERQKTIAGNVAAEKALSEESEFVNLYQNITQESESHARNVLMFIVREGEEDSPQGLN